MKNFRLLFVLVGLLTLPASIFAQGIIRGKVIDDATGEPMFGVTVVIDGTSNGKATDFDGNFEIKADAGTYKLRVSFISYKTLLIEGVEVQAGEVNALGTIRLPEDVETLDEVVVTAEILKDTEEALLTVKRKSANLLDGISSANFSLVGDGDAAAAVKRVPGVSIEGGKYVYVRGLGDRYTKSTLNGVDIPGLDPDRNSIQMDMFPTSLINNIMVVKSFTADLPADFTGGVVNISTKDFPEEKVFSVSLSGGYNPSMHFKNDFVTNEGSSTDFLGYDDGKRIIPTDGIDDIPLYGEVIGKPDTERGQLFQEILGDFDPIMAPFRDNSFMDFGAGLAFGNQINKGANTWGYNLTLNYDNETEYLKDIEYSAYRKNSDSTVYDLSQQEYRSGDLGKKIVNLSGLAGIALKRENAKYILNVLHTQNGESRSGLFDLDVSRNGSNFMASQYNIEYTERALTNVMLNGVHYDNSKTWKIEWKLSPTRSTLNDPDVRVARIRNDSGNLTIGSEVGYPERIWRTLDEKIIVGKLDLQKELQLFSRDAKILFGGIYTDKQRDFNIESFQIVPFQVDINEDDPNIIFQPENLWPSDGNGFTGTRYEPTFIPRNANKYDASITNIGAYISSELQPAELLKAIVGVRMEKYTQQYTGINQQGTIELDNEKVIDDLDIFPTVNLIYSLKENHNLRVSYAKTIARPSFKEASYAQIYDPITNRVFLGGLSEITSTSNGETTVYWDGNLTATNIDNIDLRWEMFQAKGQTISISGFAKFFDRPIEIVRVATADNNFQPRNVGDGQVLGIELELRKNFEFISPVLDRFSFNGNFTFVKSQIKMDKTEFDARVQSKRDGETIDETRDMAGQAPYLINAGLSYKSPSGLDAGLFFNVQGRTLHYVGTAEQPDVYAVPFQSLNFNANKRLGVQERLSVGIKVENILNDKKEIVAESYNTNDEIFESYSPGTAFSVRLGYKL
ncbi:TonB-dependent receptor [Flammeovirgaceae bacterium SG7u.111]|nr:TonB-dependent receptor [Flammeovirgaceae bacterium SG7u.132]WPO36714.1 TonB-dependent receptor [Flammeovirgaceae bacterium SG7u.111]